MRSRLTALLVMLLWPSVVNAANHYIRQGASGSADGSDWTNAFTAIPSTFVRGDVYFIADGAYAKWTLSTHTTSGTTMSFLLKATVAAHGTATGWSDAFGNDEAVISGFDHTATTGYLTIDGVNTTCGILVAHAAQACGIKFALTANFDQVINFLNGGNNSLITRVEINGPAGDSTAPFDFGNGDSHCVAADGGGATDTTVSHNWIHGCSTQIGATSTGLIVEYNDISDSLATGGGGDPAHENIWFIGFEGNDLTFRYNRVSNFEAEGIFITWYNGGDGSDTTHPPHHIYVYGNTFYNSGGQGDFPRGMELRQGNGVGYDNIHFYNNTCYGLDRCFYDRGDEASSADATNSFARNNISAPASAPITCPTVTCSNNTVVSSDPFVSASTGNFLLLAASAAGFTLASPYTTDPLGNTRGASGVWDQGAYEFCAGGCAGEPDPPVGLRIATKGLMRGRIR